MQNKSVCIVVIDPNGNGTATSGGFQTGDDLDGLEPQMIVIRAAHKY